jgi:hypothetical protein
MAKPSSSRPAPTPVTVQQVHADNGADPDGNVVGLADDAEDGRTEAGGRFRLAPPEPGGREEAQHQGRDPGIPA